MRVLVVDDEPLVRLDLVQALVAAGHRVDGASNGRDALAAMRRSLPDLVLLDLRMPVMDGYQFRAEQLQDPALRDVPVVVVSATSNTRPACTVPPLSAAAVLTKPIHMDALLQAVAKLGTRPAS